MEHECRHQCLIYEGSPSEQLPSLAAMIRRKLDEGHRCLYLNSRPMVAGMRSYLSATGIDVVQEIAKASLVLSSDPSVSSDGDFNVDVMLHRLEDALEQALDDGYKGILCTGDMTYEFGPRKDFSKLMEYEWRLEDLFRKRQEIFGICQYHRDSLPHEATRQALLTHRELFINETLSRINPHFIPSRPADIHDAKNRALDEMIGTLCQLQNRKSGSQASI
jgi:hypothetical protein